MVLSSRDVQAHRGLGWSSAQPPSRRASLLSHQAAPLVFSRTHGRAPSGGRTPGRRSCGAARVEPGARCPAHPTGAGAGSPGVWRAAARAPMNLRGASARVRGRAPPPWRAPQGERAPRAGAHTETELYYLAPSRASLLSGHSNSFPTSPAKDFSPPLLSRRPSISTCGGGRAEEEGGKRKEEKAKA